MSDLPRVFSPEYYHRLHEVEDRHWWSIGMREIERQLVRRHLVTGAVRVLDAGCGTGAMLGFLAAFSGQRPVAGVDVAPQALEHCRRRGHTTVALGSVIELPLADRAFDLVHSGDVLQHLPTERGPERALAEAYRVLRPGGLLFVRTNVGTSGTNAAADYQRFDPARLRALVEAAGFDLLHASRVNFLPSLAAELRDRFRRRYGAEHGEADQDHGLGIRIDPQSPAWRDALLLRTLRVEAWYLARLGGRLPFGHSQVCLARRPGDPG